MEIYIGTYDGCVSIFHATPTQIKLFRNFKLSENSIKDISLVGDGNFLVAGGFDQQLKVIDLNEYNERIEAKEHTGQITSLCKLGNKSFYTGSNDGTIRLWNCNEWVICKSSKNHKKAISQIVTDPSQKLMMSVGGNKLNIWSAKTLKMAYEYKMQQNQEIEHLCISDSLSKVFISTSKGELKIINTENNQIFTLFTLQIPRKIQKFIYWQGFIIVATDKGQIMAWKVQNQSQQNNQSQQLHNKVWFKAHQSRIKDLKIVYEDFLVIATAAGEMSIWDFPQFLSSVENISQDYHLEGLQPLTSFTIKSRIICLEVKEMGIVNDDDEMQNKQKSEQIQQKEEKQKNLVKKGHKIHKKMKQKGDLNKNKKKQ